MALKMCLGVFSLRGGTAFAALVSAVVFMLVFQECVDACATLLQTGRTSGFFRRIGRYQFDGGIWVVIASVSYSGAAFLSSVLGLMGVCKEKSGWLTEFMYLLFINAMLALGIFIWISVMYAFYLKMFFYTMDILILNLYFCFVVYSYKNSSEFDVATLEMINNVISAMTAERENTE